MKLLVRRWLTLVDETAVPPGGIPLRKVAVVAIVPNPYAGMPMVEDLSPLIAASEAVGADVATRAVSAMHPYAVQSYGKGGVAGLGGEQEHVNAMLTTTFAEPLRREVGGAAAWISSFTKCGGPGVSIDIPLAHKDALYVRSHYDGMTLSLNDAPQADELALIVVLANRGRIDARVGGLRADEVVGRDGLR